MKKTYENAKPPEVVRPVNENGITLNPIVNGLVLPGLNNSDTYIKYYTYPDQPGMIYYYYGIKPKEEYALSTEMAKALLESKIKECKKETSTVTVPQRPNIEWPSIDLEWPSIDSGNSALWKAGLGILGGLLLGAAAVA